MLSIDQRIRDYEPFFDKWYLNDPPEILGQGSSGTVYLVHSYDDMSAALKVISIPRDEAQYNALLRHFGGSTAMVNAWIDQEMRYAQSEIEIMDRLKRENHIVCFEDAVIIQRADTYGYDVVIRMERLVRLDEFMRTCEIRYQFKRGERLYLRLWQEIAQGLSFCEHYGIVHFDVKPENIFYAEPSRDLFKLGDFGVSIRSDNGRRVGEGMIVGTRNYMAPEIAQASGGDIRSDMYSLGLVVYQLFNDDRLPFVHNPLASDQEYDQALAQRFGGAAVPPPKNMSPALWPILRRCLAFNPNDRYPTMQALIDDLEVYRRQLEKKSIFRHVLRPAILGAVAALMIVLMIVITRPTTPAAPQGGPTAAQGVGPMAGAGGDRHLPDDLKPGPADMALPGEGEALSAPVSEPKPARRSAVPIALGAAALAGALAGLMGLLVRNARLEIGDDRHKGQGQGAPKRRPMRSELRFALTAGITLVTAGLGVALYALITAAL